MVDLQALTCPQCGSARVERTAGGIFRCRSCDTRLLLVDSLGKLVVPDVHGWVDCPRCGTPNSAEHFFCTHCGAPVRYKCANCGTVRTADEPVCGVCGYTQEQAKVVAQARVHNRRWRKYAVGWGLVGAFIVLSAWLCVVTSMDWRNNAAINALFTALFCATPLAGVAAGVGIYVFKRRPLPEKPET